MYTSNNCLLMFSVLCIQAAMSHTVTLTTKESQIFEKDDLLMICASNDTNRYPYSYWDKGAREDDLSKLPKLGLSYNNCTATGILSDKSLYERNCYTNGTFTLSLKSVNRTQHGEKWRCLKRYGGQNAQASNTISVYVKVPVENVRISPHQNDVLTQCEFTTVQMTCITSEARPEPTISWIFQNRLSMYKFSVNGSSLVSNDTGIFVTKNELDFSPNRSLNNWNVVCTSSNLPGLEVNSSIKLNITYPPESLPVIKNSNVSNIETYYIIEHHEGKLTCVVRGGNPTAKLKWICINNDKPAVVSSQEVTQDVVWNASRNDTGTCKCIAEHTCHNWTRTVMVKIKVMYPPVIETIDDISVIEGSVLNISCKATRGVPEAMTTHWKRENGEFEVDSQELFIAEVSRKDISNYTCTVRNKMTPTGGTQEYGKDSAMFSLDVLYPALVDKINNTAVIEGHVLNITCPIVQGNPRKASVIWTPGGELGELNNGILYIPSVSKNDKQIYTCSVNTTMKPTHSDPISKVEKGQFQLTVLYKATITKFSVGGEADNDTVTVNEAENLTFICYFDSEPPPNATLLYDSQKIHMSNKNILEYTKQNMQCNDSGVYMCTGMNEYNDRIPSSRNRTLYVNCSPRPNPEVTLLERVVSGRNTSATLRFTALAHPRPGPSGFTWHFIDKSGNVSLTNNSYVLIQSSDMQSNLTIKNVSEHNYGQYMLHINNTRGVFKQSFFLTPYEEPDPPVILNLTAGKTYVTLYIEAGFNGGFPQWFNLRYFEVTREIWSNVFTIRDNVLNVFSHTIVGLSSGKAYKVIVYAENELGNSSEVMILATTKETLTTTKPIVSGSSTIAGIVAGTVLGVIAVVCIVIAVVFFLRKRNKQEEGKGIYQNVLYSGQKMKTKRKTNHLHVDETSLEDLQEVDDVPNVINEPTEYYNSPDIIEKIEKIKVSELYSYVIGKSDDFFGASYQKLPTGLQNPCTFARKPENIALNRYNGIYPYDHSRVKLHGYPGFFINACYIDGYKRSKAYIASLGPTSKTTDNFATFWQMIWHEKSDIIVMLTNLKEPSGMKCEQYWPVTGTNKTYGDVCVSSQKAHVFAEYTVRYLIISKEDERRHVTHLHYTAWPDKKVPEDVTSLIEFRQRMKDTPTSSEGPVVIHCSAGIGRTGTLIALDRLIDEGQCEGSVNVYECVNSIREQRVKMVQTSEQYIYIYKALVNALSFECETIPVESFSEYVDSTNNNIYSKQFQQLRLSVEPDSKEDLEAFAVNEKKEDKNRRGADIPGSRSRVLLYLNRVDEQSDYINAVYVNSFKKKDYFIVAQSPLPNTVSDFVCMVYQEDCTCIVTMDDLNEAGMMVGQYLPADKQTLTFGNFMVSCSTLETKQQYVVRKMKIKYNGKFESGEKVIYHFQYTKWMTVNVTPSSADEFVQFVNDVEEYASQLGEDRSHVLVHCLKANERCGLFCAVAILMEKTKFERQVNVLNTLRHLRNRRRSAITDMEQLKFCYLAICAYIKMYRP